MQPSKYDKEQVRKLYELVATNQKLTKDDRVLVKALAMIYGVTISNTRCRDCYNDAVIQMAAMDRKSEMKASNGTHVLREPYATEGINHNGRIYNQATMPQSVAEYLYTHARHLFEQ